MPVEIQTAEEDRLTTLQTLFKSTRHQLVTGQVPLLRDVGLPVVEEETHA